VTANIGGGTANQFAYVWTVNGQPAGQGPTFDFNSTDKQPGVYTIGLTIKSNNYNPASAQTTVTVLEYQPPTGTATADPAQITLGEKSTVSASFHGQCGGPIQPPTFEASEGSMNGNVFDSTGVQFDASNNAEQHKSVTI